MKQFSGSMVVVVFLYVFFIFLDRIVYTTLDKSASKFIKMYFNKATGERYNSKQSKVQVHNSICNDKKEDQSTLGIGVEFNIEDWEEMYIQQEKENLALKLKYILTLMFMVLSHLFIFFYLPFKGNQNIHFSIYCDRKSFENKNTDGSSLTESSYKICNDFDSNPKLIIFYILHLFYYTFSALQIRYGLLDMKKTSLLMRKDDLTNYVLFKIYKAIPFLYELKLLIDWTFTSTSLDLFQWIKLENVHDLLFIAKCYFKSYASKVFGDKIYILEKLLFGVSFLILILGCLLGPIWLFSSLNPTNEINNVIAGKLKLTMQIKDKNNFLVFNLFESKILTKIRNISDEEFISNGLDKVVEAANFPKEQIQIITFHNVAEIKWDLPEPHINFLINNLLSENENIEVLLNITNEFERKVSKFILNLC
jgi:hypothetical protein